jgi:hypothetical protein
MVQTPEPVQDVVRRKAGERSAQFAAALKPFLERPGALTFHEAEKAVHNLARKLADDIVADALTSVTRDPAFIDAAVRTAGEKGGDASTTRSAAQRSSSGAEPS